MARGITALAALGLVYSDQGSAVNDRAWLRGTVARVVNNLALCAGGLKTIAEAVEFMEGRQELPPLLYDADGEPVLVDGEEARLVAAQGANLKLRALAFRDAKPDDSRCGGGGRFAALPFHQPAKQGCLGPDGVGRSRRTPL